MQRTDVLECARVFENWVALLSCYLTLEARKARVPSMVAKRNLFARMGVVGDEKFVRDGRHDSERNRSFSAGKDIGGGRVDEARVESGTESENWETTSGFNRENE